jgi:hypothetical protein
MWGKSVTLLRVHKEIHSSDAEIDWEENKSFACMNPMKQGVLVHVDSVSVRIISFIARQALREE